MGAIFASIKKMVSTRQNRSIGIRLAFFLFALMVGVIVANLPLGLATEEKAVLGVVLFMILLFITGAVPLSVAGLMGCFGFWAICGLSFETAFSGFSMETTWFIFGALLIGSLAAKTQLPQRIAYRFIKRVSPSYPVLLAALIFLDLLLTIVMPSGAPRVVILCTIAIGLVHSFGLDVKSNIGRGMILTLTFSATLFDKTILAGAASILSRGFIADATGYSIGWGEWFLAYAPINIIIMGACWLLTLKMFPPEKQRFGGEAQQSLIQKRLKEIGPITFRDIRGIAMIGIATLLWATDSLHGIPAEVIAVGIGLLAFVPKIGILNKEDFEKVNFSVIIFIAAALSMTAVLRETSTLETLTSGLFSWLIPLIGNDQLLSLGLYLLANVFHLFLGSEPAMLSVSMPLVMNFAEVHALNPEAIGMIWTFAAGGKLFVYQSAILVLGYSYGAFTLRDLFKMGFALIIVEAICVSLIVPAYWPLIGISIQ